MRNLLLSALALSTVLLGGCDPEPVDASRTVADIAVPDVAHAPSDVIVLLDVSHSMTRRQLATARSLLAALWRVLDEHDRFALVTIRTEASLLVELAPATPEAKADWSRTVGALDGEGLTNLEAGFDLAKAIAGPDARVLFVGDGSPTWGLVTSDDLVEAAEGLSLWTVGVGRHDEALLRRLGRYIDGSDAAVVVGELLIRGSASSHEKR